jgi:hypothetical protein
MSMLDVDQIIDAVYYCTGRYCSKEEAYEILSFVDGSRASLDEVISDYYGC